MEINAALKEWSVAVDALAAGETMLLLRKGGIKEVGGRFCAQAEQVVLFPTFEHQKPELLKPQYQSAVQPVEQGWHPQTITLKAWAEVTNIFLTYEADKVAALADFHIWQPSLAQTRLKWKAKQPLYVLTLRAYRLPTPIKVDWDDAYGGCRSWITLADDIRVDENEALAAMKVAEYQDRVDAIAQILSA
ncbi:MAG: DUF1802 family protein [Cyanobacteria bacterium P01_D01_bin.36]